MVYSMLSSGAKWNRLINEIDITTGTLPKVDKIFENYEPDKLLSHTPEEIRDKLKEAGFASQYTLKQMTALLTNNIPKLINYEKQYGSTDQYYQSYIQQDSTLKSLVKALSYSNSKDKMIQLYIALNCEYLRNVGYDIPKPDRHICRLLGSNHLGLSNKKKTSAWEAFALVQKLADDIGKGVAETDYILWSYCADGFGEICTKSNPKCNECVIQQCPKNE